MLARLPAFWLLSFLNWSAIPVLFLWQFLVPHTTIKGLGMLVGLVVMNLAGTLAGWFCSRAFFGAGGRALLRYTLLSGIAISVFACVGGSWLGYPAFFLHVFCHTIAVFILGGELHSHVTDDIRSTAFSCVTLSTTLGALVLLPSTGALASHVGPFWAALVGVPLLLPICVSGGTKGRFSYDAYLAQ